MAEPAKVEARLYWSARDEEGKVKLARGFDAWARDNPGNWIHAMDAIQDWISELARLHAALFSEWDDVASRHRARKEERRDG